MISALAIPKEHGAWAMLLMPYIVGTAVAGWGGWPSFLLLLAVVSLFGSSKSASIVLREVHSAGMARTSVHRPAGWWSRLYAAVARLSGYVAVSGLASAILLLAYQHWALLAIGAGATAVLALQLLLRQWRLDRAWPSRLLAVAALSTTGPAAYYAASGVLDRDALAVWALTFLYSGASVFYVRLVYRSTGKSDPANVNAGRIRAERNVLAYVVIATAVVMGLLVSGWAPPLSPLALFPLVVKACWAIGRRDYHPTLKQVGMAELGHASLFALLAVLAFALQ